MNCSVLPLRTKHMRAEGGRQIMESVQGPTEFGKVREPQVRRCTVGVVVAMGSGHVRGHRGSCAVAQSFPENQGKSAFD